MNHLFPGITHESVWSLDVSSWTRAALEVDAWLKSREAANQNTPRGRRPRIRPR